MYSCAYVFVVGSIAISVGMTICWCGSITVLMVEYRSKPADVGVDRVGSLALSESNCTLSVVLLMAVISSCALEFRLLNPDF